MGSRVIVFAYFQLKREEDRKTEREIAKGRPEGKNKVDRTDLGRPTNGWMNESMNEA